MTPGQRRANGFTLIEVLVVVAIIALLVSILIPTLAEAKRQARRAVCGSNLHQIAAGLLTYRETYKDFPNQVLTEFDFASGQGDSTLFWSYRVHDAIARFIGKVNKDRPNEVFYCPTVRESDRGTDTDRKDGGWSDALDGAIPNAEWLHITYSYYGRLNMGKKNDPALPRSGDADKNGDATIDKYDLPRKRTHYVIKEPDSQRILMGDQIMFWTVPRKWRINHGPWYDQRHQSGSKLPFRGQQMGYGDGHVEWHKDDQFPVELRQSADPNDLKASATFIRDIRGGLDLHWW